MKWPLAVLPALVALLCVSLAAGAQVLPASPQSPAADPVPVLAIDPGASAGPLLPSDPTPSVAAPTPQGPSDPASDGGLVAEPTPSSPELPGTSAIPPVAGLAPSAPPGGPTDPVLDTFGPAPSAQSAPGLHVGAGTGPGGVDVGVGIVGPSPAVGPASVAASPPRGAGWERSALEQTGHVASASALTLLLVALGSGLDGLADLARLGARLAGRPLGWLRPLPRLVARAGSGALRGLATAFGGLGVGAGAMPLFSRLEHGRLLDNPVRARLHRAIVEQPGLSVEEARGCADVAWGTAVHHLRKMEEAGLVVCVSQDARRRYFAANTPAARNRVQIAALSHPTPRRVADLVRRRPGIDQSALCGELGLLAPAASKQLGHLAQHGLVSTQRLGRRRLYHPTPALLDAFAVLEPLVRPAAASTLAVPADRPAATVA